MPRTDPDHNPIELKTWAKRTGFNSNSGEISRPLPKPSSTTGPTRTFHDQPTTSAGPTSQPEDSAPKGPERPNRVRFNPVRLGRRLRERWEESTSINKSAGFSDTSEDLEKGLDRAPLPDRAVHPHPDQVEIEPAQGGERRRNAGHVRGEGDVGLKKETEGVDLHEKRFERELDSGVLSDSQWEVEGEELRDKEVYRPNGLKCGVTENPGWGKLVLLFIYFYFYLLVGIITFNTT